MPDWEHAVREREETLRAAFIVGDVATVRGLLDDGYHANSPLDKVAPAPMVLQLLGAGTIRNLAADSRIELIRLFGDTAIMMGQDEVVDPLDAHRYTRRLSDVWQLQEGHWKLVARHAHVLS